MTITASIAATASARYVALAVSISGASSAARYTVYRIIDGFDPAGPEPRFCVRGMREVDPASYTTCYDVDFPQGSTVAYKVRVVDGGTTVTSSASGTLPAIDLGADYILGTSSDAVGVPVIVSAMPSWDRPSKSTELKVIGRRDPVVLADRRQYPTFDLTLATLGSTNRQTMEDLVNRYPVLTFSPRDPVMAGQVTAIHVSVASAVEAPAGTNASIERLWTLRCSQVGAPYVPRCSSIPTGWNASPNLEA